ncbi:MAG: TIGR00296 family protein [Candidatus Woesearchaeota archaeon]
MIRKEDREKLLQLARKSIEAELRGDVLKVDDEIIRKFSEHKGVFVTLKEMGELRGCIGYPEPVLPLWQAVSRAAVAAAFEDPRFPPLLEEELKDVKIEISVLTVPELLEVNSPSEYLKKIRIGKDGLILRYKGFSGLLLPQVAPEQGWNVEQFLEGLCEKAGVPPGTWKHPRCEIYTFQAEVFGE